MFRFREPSAGWIQPEDGFYKAGTCHLYIINKVVLNLFLYSFMNSIFKHNGEVLLKNSKSIIYFRRRVMPSTSTA
jgi:hypothetical protein